MVSWLLSKLFPPALTLHDERRRAWGDLVPKYRLSDSGRR